MKKYPRLYSIAFLLLSILLRTVDSTACGPTPDPYENRITFFNPEIFADTIYRIAYWDSKHYKKEPAWNASLEERHAFNVTDWHAYFQEKPSKKDIAEVVYNADSLILQKLYNQIAYGKPYAISPPDWKNNTLLRHLYDTKDIDAINYLIIAKRCEPYVTYDPWNEQEVDESKIDGLIDYIVIKLRNCRTDFIKIRYAYQAVRLAHYTGRYQKAINIYTKFAAGLIGRQTQDQAAINQSVIRYWTMALRAGAHKRLGQHPQAMYGFSRVFWESPDMKQLALQNFEYSGEQDWQQVMKITERNPSSAAGLWAMRGFKNKQLGFEAMKEFYRVLPYNELLEVMLIREINKIEAKLLSPTMTQFIPMDDGRNTQGAKRSIYSSNSQASIWESIQNFFQNMWNTIVGWFSSDEVIELEESITPKITDTSYIQDFRAFVDTVRTNGGTVNPPLWDTASAYLSYLLQQYDEAEKALDLAAKTATSTKIQQQALLVRSLVRLAKKGKMNEGLENTFYLALKDLEKPAYSYENFGVYSRSMAHIARSYLLEGNIAKAILYFNQAKETEAAQILIDFYASQSDLEELHQLTANSNKRPFEAQLFEDSVFVEDKVLDIMATKLMRTREFEKALEVFRKVSPDYWQSLEEKESWFGEKYNKIPCSLNHNPLSNEPIGDFCNKMEFAQKVVDLQQKIKENPVEANLQLGNLFVNTPFWGYSGNLWEGSLVSTLREYETPYSGEFGIGTYPFNLATLTDTLQSSIQHFIEEYDSRNLALQYYQTAMKQAQDSQKELAAQAAYLAQYCQVHPLTSLHTVNTQDSTFAKILATDYGETQFFQKIIQECPNLKDYQ